MTSARAKAEEFKSSIEKKIRALIVEFSDGKISREQFHTIYERYNAQLAIATHALMSGNPDAYSIAEDGMSTIAIRSELMGKAMGLMIYHNKSGTILETLGDFDVPVTYISPILSTISLMMDQGKFIERRVEQYGEKQWLHYAAGRYSTIVTEFHHEPSQHQSLELERLLHDFEHANQVLLQREMVDAQKLGYPFVVFIRKKFGS